MKRSILWIILLVILLAIVVLAIGSALSSCNGDHIDEGDTYDQEIVLVNTNFPTDVVLLGEDIYFRPAFQYRKIDKITEDSLSYDTNKFHRLVLIISDLDSTVQLEEEEYKIVKELLDADAIDYYYLGTSKVDDLMKFGLWEVMTVTDEDELGIGVCKYYNMQTQFTIWTQYDADMTINNNEALGCCIVAQIAGCIKSNN